MGAKFCCSQDSYPVSEYNVVWYGVGDMSA